MRELLYSAAKHYKRGRELAERGDVRGAVAAYGEAVRDLHAVKPQRMRDVLLAQVHLSRYRVAQVLDADEALEDLRLGYSYARTTREPAVEAIAQELWQAYLNERKQKGIELLAASD